MRDGGKGDKQRPLSVSQKDFDDAWDRIFKQKDGSLTINEAGGEITIRGNNDKERQKTVKSND